MGCSCDWLGKIIRHLNNDNKGTKTSINHPTQCLQFHKLASVCMLSSGSREKHALNHHQIPSPMSCPSGSKDQM